MEYNSDQFLVYSQVATVLLIGAFFYDIFWVFISPFIFHESVMVAVRLFIIH